MLEVDGQRLSWSDAILTWLAGTTGKFASAGEEERFEALRWILFDNYKFTGGFAPYRMQYPLAPHPSVQSFLKAPKAALPGRKPRYELMPVGVSLNVMRRPTA